MNVTTRLTFRATVFGVVLIFVTACATTLAPNYDKAIVEGLTLTSIKLMGLFASVSSGTTKNSFEKREDTYNEIIGSLDALVILVKARPVPKNKITEIVNEYLAKRGVTNLDDEEAPSATAIEKISATLLKMRDTDKKQGVTSFEVAAFKGQVVIYLDQALTYESFLDRE